MARIATNTIATNTWPEDQVVEAFNPREWCTLMQGAHYLGMKRSTIYTWVADGKIESVQVTGRIMLRRADIERIARARADLADALTPNTSKEW